MISTAEVVVIIKCDVSRGEFGRIRLGAISINLRSFS
jgi:hypothetical protein